MTNGYRKNGQRKWADKKSLLNVFEINPLHSSRIWSTVIQKWDFYIRGIKLLVATLVFCYIPLCSMLTVATEEYQLMLKLEIT